MVEQVSARDSWTALQADRDAVLVDVRTPAEWQEIGLPDLASLGRSVVRLTWQPGGEVAFAEGLVEAAPNPAAPLYMLCRSGMRSQAASLLAEHIGYTSVHNVADGFEGPPDATGARGRVAGWQEAGLPQERG